MAGLTRRVRPWICCYSSHRNLSWHGDLAERKMQTVESLVCGLGWETWAALGVCHSAGVCASREGRHAEPPGRGHRWHQAASAGTGVPREPGPGIPSPSMLSAQPWRCQPQSMAVGGWGFIFRGGKLGGGFRCTQRWTTGLPLSTGAVLTVCNPSETPVLTLESFFFNLVYPVFKFQCFAGNSLFRWNTVRIFGVNGSSLNWELVNLWAPSRGLPVNYSVFHPPKFLFFHV